MSEKMNCNVIRDILPSYIDGLCSEESIKCVEEHLKTCQDCKEIYEAMKSDMKVGYAGKGNISVDTEKIMKEVSSKMAADVRKKTNIYRAVIALIIVIIAILVLPLKSISADKMEISYQNYLIADYIDKESAKTAGEVMNVTYEGATILLDDEANPDEATVYLISVPDENVGDIYADELWISKHEYIAIAEVRAKYDIKSFKSYMDGDVLVVNKAKTSILSGEKAGYSGQVAIYGQKINSVEIR